MTNPFEEPRPRKISRRRRLFQRTRANFLTGLVVLVPIGLTIYLFWTFVGWIDSWVLPFIPAAYQPDALAKRIFGPDASVNIRGVGLVVFIFVTLLIGWIAKGVIGRSVLDWAEGLVNRMPVVRSVYKGLKQILETVLSQTETSFQQACLVEYPRKGLWAIAFISTPAKGEINSHIPHDEKILSVFLPTTPNPTSGFLLYVPESDVIILDMSVEDAAKLVISAGLVYPKPHGEEGAPQGQIEAAEKGSAAPARQSSPAQDEERPGIAAK